MRYEQYIKIEQDCNNIKANEIYSFEYQGENIDYKGLVDLAHSVYCKMLDPIFSKDKKIIRFQKLDKQSSFHTQNIDPQEKYGTSSIFATIDKNSQPSFLIHYLKALQSVNIDKRYKILNLGVNSGGEFELIKKHSTNFKNLKLVGIDYCSSAIDEAKKRFDDENIEFIQADITDMEHLNLGQFDLIISIGTLQSTNLDFNKIFMKIVQNHLKKDGAMILGFPNCRWIEDQMIYGAMVKNYNYSELSLLFKDVNYCKKYLQQKKYRVTITGKDYIFLTATSIRKDDITNIKDKNNG